ncbi:MAG: penicillin-binding protein activator [Magnetospirillum sp.]|nr:penicillin-binding protein activator [Magnetospirillum sp.]
MGGTKPAPQAQVPPPRAAEPPKTSAQAPQPPRPAVQAPPKVQTEPLPPATQPTPPGTVPGPQMGAPPKGLEQGEVRAALLLPLTGPYAVFGQTLSNAAQLALFEVADGRFNLIPLDTKGTAEGAAAAARMALAQGADVILGPVFSPEVKAVAPLAREQAVPMLAFTTDRTAAGQGVYAMGFLPGPQVARVVAYAQSQGKSRLAVLAPATDYGRAVAEAARTAAAAAGGQVVRVEFYDPAAQDLTNAVKRFAEFDSRARALAREKAAVAARNDDVARAVMKKLDTLQTFGDTPFDAVLIPDDGVRLRSIASLLAYWDLDGEQVRLLGTMLWDDPKLGVEPALIGGWYPAPAPVTHADFERRYERAFGAVPPRVGSLAGIAYDATALAGALARQGVGGYPAAALQNPNGFAGVDGIFRLTAEGIAERGLAVREITRNGSKEISPPPESFVAGQQAPAE